MFSLLKAPISPVSRNGGDILGGFILVRQYFYDRDGFSIQLQPLLGSRQRTDRAMYKTALLITTVTARLSDSSTLRTSPHHPYPDCIPFAGRVSTHRNSNTQHLSLDAQKPSTIGSCRFRGGDGAAVIEQASGIATPPRARNRVDVMDRHRVADVWRWLFCRRWRQTVRTVRGLSWQQG